MNFSDQWRSLWPVSSVFPAPNLLSGPSSTSFGPLLFYPSPPRPHTLLSSPSLSLQIPPPLPPSNLLNGIRSFFQSPSNESFLPSAAHHSLAADALSGPAADPIPANTLHALRCRNPSTFLLFFPTGENANSIGFVCLSFKESGPVVSVDRNGDVFKQTEGFKHPYHRILKMSVVPAGAGAGAGADELSGNSDSIVEGFLIAATMYSVNWFRVETRVSNSGQERPFLVPLAKQGFESCVVHTCCSPHFREESVVLLETGELFWFNLNSKRGGTVRVTVGREDPGEWLSCEYGGQPWILFVACSSAVVMVDLRSKKGTEPKVLASIGMLDSLNGVPSREQDDKFLAFCRAGFNHFYMSLVTKHQLLLFDARQPLYPMLTWDHGLLCPGFVTMYRLSELRPSDEFKWASESGFVILVGSFWNDEFNLFCYGPREGGALGNSSLYSWELPSCLPLSGRQCASGDNLVKEMLYKEDHPIDLKWKPRNDVVVGFWIVPNDLLKFEQRSGFALIRLMLSGKLELQKFHASWDLLSEKSHEEEAGLLELKDSLMLCMGQEYRVSTRYQFFKFSYLYEYMNGSLSKALVMHGLSHSETNKSSSNSYLKEAVSNKLRSSNFPVSVYVSDATIPTSIFEIASRRVLNCLETDLLPLGFSRYSDLCGGQRESSFAFLEVPNCLPHHRTPPFFLGKPLRRGERWSKKAVREETLAGPVLPLPILLSIQEMDKKKNPSSLKEADDDLLNIQCKKVLENVFPEISIADAGNSSEWASSQELQDEKPFFVYEPTSMLYRSTCNGTISSTKVAVEEVPERDHKTQPCLIPEAAYKDEKFTTFVCGIAEEKCFSSSVSESIGLEMFDLGPARLDFESSSTMFQPLEQKIYKCLKRQFSNWQGSYKPYQDFCNKYKIPKLS